MAIRFELIKEIIINRCLYGLIDNTQNCTLHGFSDASMKAYSAVIYFVCELNGCIHVELLTSKTRIAPLKTQTIPRLELMSAFILAKLMSRVQKALGHEVTELKTRFWVESKTVLCLINNKGEWKQFVRYRVNEILKLSDKANWGHCPGEQNPADIGSRGCNASSLKANA